MIWEHYFMVKFKKTYTYLDIIIHKVLQLGDWSAQFHCIKK
jgi:hypothetical protein